MDFSLLLVHAGYCATVYFYVMAICLNINNSRFCNDDIVCPFRCIVDVAVIFSVARIVFNGKCRQNGIFSFTSSNIFFKIHRCILHRFIIINRNLQNSVSVNSQLIYGLCIGCIIFY